MHRWHGYRERRRRKGWGEKKRRRRRSKRSGAGGGNQLVPMRASEVVVGVQSKWTWGGRGESGCGAANGLLKVRDRGYKRLLQWTEVVVEAVERKGDSGRGRRTRRVERNVWRRRKTSSCAIEAAFP